MHPLPDIHFAKCLLYGLLCSAGVDDFTFWAPSSCSTEELVHVASCKAKEWTVYQILNRLFGFKHAADDGISVVFL